MGPTDEPTCTTRPAQPIATPLDNDCSAQGLIFPWARYADTFYSTAPATYAARRLIEINFSFISEKNASREVAIKFSPNARRLVTGTDCTAPCIVICDIVT